MNLLKLFRQKSDRSNRQLQASRRPLVEALEGRQLQSGLTTTADIVGQHIGAPAIQRKHIGVAAIVGQHIGVAAIQGNHIGVAAIVGSHIGTNVSSFA